MKIFCPKCNQKYDLSEEFIGEEVECFVCNYEFEVKLPPVSAAPPTDSDKKIAPDVGKTKPTTKDTPLAIGQTVPTTKDTPLAIGKTKPTTKDTPLATGQTEPTTKDMPLAIGQTVPTTRDIPLAVAKKAVILPEKKPEAPVVKKAVIPPEKKADVPDEKIIPEPEKPAVEEIESPAQAPPVAAEKTVAVLPAEEPVVEDVVTQSPQVPEKIVEEKTVLPVDEKLALARKKSEQEEAPEPQVAVRKSKFRGIGSISRETIPDEDEEPDLPSDDIPDETPTTESASANENPVKGEKSSESENENVPDDDESEADKGKNAFANSKKFSAPESKKKYIVGIAALACSVLANAGIYFSAETFYFLPSFILLVIAFLLSLAAIYQRRVIPGLVALLLTLLIPSFLSTENFDKGIAALFINNESMDDDDFEQDNAGSESDNQKQADINDLYRDPDKLETQKSAEKLPKELPSQKIIGAFGLKLGAVFNPAKALDSTTIATGETIYRIKPKEKFRKFTNYYVLITPVGKKIYAIWADVDLKKGTSAEHEYKILLTLLEAKYETKATSGIIPSTHRKSIKINNRSIYLISNITGDVRLRYTDDLLKAQAEKENVMQEAAKENTSSL
jgi:hypothetical protein